MAFANGLSAFPITPADDAGRVDVAGLRRLIRRLAAARVDSIGLLGSTGIYMYLDRDERRRAIEAALDETAGKVPVIVGIGALRTDAAISLARDAKAAGAAAGLLSAASYTPLTGDEVVAHFTAVVEASGLPLVVYDNPATTHFTFTPAEIRRLAVVPGIVAIKNPGWRPQDAGRLLAEQRATVPAGFSIGCSGDWLAAETLIAGAQTWYSVLGGILPGACLAIVRAAQAGDAQEVRRLDAELASIWGLFRQYSSLRVVYQMAELLEISRAAPPRPILRLEEAARREVGRVLAELPAHLID